MEFYRPIALISIFEKYFYGELNNYLEKNSILCQEQNGFRQKRTINMAVYNFKKHIITRVDRTSPVCALFCDMTQAFDYVNHRTLLKKLESYGIRGNILDLFQSYLSNRRQKTAITRFNMKTKTEEIHLSDERHVQYGVPQGSVLGPLLFLIYINDMPKATKQPMTLFADDSTIIIECNDINDYKFDINETLTSVISYLNNNNLKINLKKTHIMHFSQRFANPTNLEVSYQGDTISQVNTARFLGLQIDKNLNWKCHIDEVIKKNSSAAFALFRLSRTVSEGTLITAYYGLVECVLRYGLIFWGNSTNKEIAFKSQKRCIRAMFGLQSTDSCKPIFTKYKILTLPSLYILETAIFVRNNPHLFPRMCDKVVRNRRNNTRLCLHPAKTTLLRNSIVCMAPIIYNKIPDEYKTLNAKLFKMKFKRFLIDKCYYNINAFLNDKFK